ncbi:MarR family winged helix-turn-helix transcriptional regulator [Pueribacillus sp. YX66]|uniref:MarR family winged helix-turn-helix transcriptional regulator n=1 Tax=Pueribacillus sp. YX66 TaxID=3229242 RepID=UPI00358CE03A
MNEKFKEAAELFEEVMIYGTERLMKSIDLPLWYEYSPEQIQVLKILSTYGKATSSKIAQLQGVHKSAISSRIKKLEEKSLIMIKPDEQDRRSKFIFLTEKGERILQLSNEAIYKQFETLILDQVDEYEIDQFIEIFSKLKKILQLKGM